jgi:hypothetical protein
MVRIHKILTFIHVKAGKKRPHHLYTSIVLSFIKGSEREIWELRKEEKKKHVSALFDVSLFSAHEKT